MLWNQATNTADWKYVEVPYSWFVCWRDTGCLPGELIEPGDLWKIDIAISNKVNDTPGNGTVFIGPILAILGERVGVFSGVHGIQMNTDRHQCCSHLYSDNCFTVQNGSQWLTFTHQRSNCMGRLVCERRQTCSCFAWRVGCE